MNNQQIEYVSVFDNNKYDNMDLTYIIILFTIVCTLSAPINTQLPEHIANRLDNQKDAETELVKFKTEYKDAWVLKLE